jgi:hypothetical protein
LRHKGWRFLSHIWLAQCPLLSRLGNEASWNRKRRRRAIEHYQQALKFRPDFAPAKNALARLGAGQ